MLVLCVAFALQASPAAARTLQLDDYRRTAGVTSPAISPDGKHAAFVVSRISWNDDTYQRDLDLVDLSTHIRRVLLHDRKGLSDPAFAPDGTELAFIADSGSGKSAESQVWIASLNGGAPRLLTRAPDGVDQFAWSADGKRIAYVAGDPKPVLKGADRFRDSFIFTTEPITARELPRPAHLFVIDTGGGAATQLTFGTQSVALGEAQSKLSWSPDGKTIAVTMTPNAILNDEVASHIVLIDIASGRMRRLTSHDRYEADPEFSPDGKHIAYMYSKGDNQSNLTELYVTTPEGGEGIAVSHPFDRAVSDAAWLPDSQGLFFTCADAAAMVLVRAPLQGELQRVDLGALNIGSELAGAIARNGSLLFVAASTRQPAELYYRSQTGTIVKLTDENAAIAKLDLGTSERVTFPTSLGITGDAVLLKPPGFSAKRKYPLVVYIHGGPTSASTQSFDFFGQVMAAHGWLVLRPNYRGSTDLGLAYQRAVLYDPEAGPGMDIMAALDAVRARGILDERNIAVSGWSYGGIMTAWMISKYHIWSAAVSGASVNDWSTDYGVADDSSSDIALFHGSPFLAANAEEWRRASAISYAADVTTPVLILSDVGDNRDPFATSSMYWRALRDNKKTATLRVWPVDGHFPHDPVRTVDIYHYWIDYIAEHFRALR